MNSGLRFLPTRADLGLLSGCAVMDTAHNTVPGVERVDLEALTKAGQAPSHVPNIPAKPEYNGS